MLMEYRDAQPLRMLRFEGITVRSDAVPTIELLRDQAMTANAAARARGASSGSTSNTLRRLTSVGVLEAVQLPPCDHKNACSREPLTGYRCTDLGRRLLAEAKRLLEDVADTDPECSWPRWKPESIVRRAMRTQPNSVFGLSQTHRHIV